MKVAVTGATGLLGKAFIKKYAKELDIIAISRKPNTPNTVYSDFSFESLTRIFSGVDGLIHFAAQRPLGSISTNTNHKLDEVVFNASHTASLKNIVFTSSRSVYGNNEAPWVEDKSNVTPLTEYALNKAQSELTALSYNESKGMHIKILRLAQILSADEFDGSMIKTFIDNAHKKKEIIVTVEGVRREYIYINDLVEAIYIALSYPQHSGIYNLGTGECLSILELANLTAEAFGCQNLVSFIPESKVSEFSLMDSNKFYNDFNWKPKFQLKSALKSISTSYQG